MIIYKATNTINGKIYIGQTIQKLQDRIDGHVRDSKRSNRRLTYFANAIRKYGILAFNFIVIDTANSIEELNLKEQFWIDFYNSTDKLIGYNLDSGGNNCKKSDSTKDLISISSKNNWKNTEIADKMLNGLRKGTEKWIEICSNNRVEFICPQCKKTFLFPPHIANTKKFCSSDCEKLSGLYHTICKKASNIAAEKSHSDNIANKSLIAQDILQWAIDNKEQVIACKYNNIKPYFQNLLDYLSDKYSLKDLRSYYLCFNVATGRDFAKYLKSYVSEENICCAGLN